MDFSQNIDSVRRKAQSQNKRKKCILNSIFADTVALLVYLLLQRSWGNSLLYSYSCQFSGVFLPHSSDFPQVCTYRYTLSWIYWLTTYFLLTILNIILSPIWVALINTIQHTAQYIPVYEDTEISNVLFYLVYLKNLPEGPVLVDSFHTLDLQIGNKLF